MTHLFLIIAVVAVMVVALVPAAPTSAQTNPPTWTKTEAQINSSFRVTNPARATVSNVRVDLQPNQVVVFATVTPRRSGNATTPPVFNTQTTATAAVVNGRVQWTVTSIVVNSTTASPELLAQVNASISSSWRNYIRTNFGQRTVTSVVITDDAITVTFAGRAS